MATEAQMRAVKKYMKNNYTRLNIFIQNEKYPAFEKWMNELGCSKNGLVNRALDYYIQALENGEVEKN